MSGPAPGGAGHNIVAELALREVIMVGLHRLAEDRKAIEELVAREDDLLHGSQDSWASELRAQLLEMLTPGSALYVEVGTNYPHDVAQLPYVSVVEESGGENEGEAVMGDLLHTHYELVGPVQPDGFLNSERHDTYGTGETSRVQIGCWTTAPERSLLLRAAVQHAVFLGKATLRERGVHEVTYSRGGIEVAEELMPRVGYLPMLSVTLKWTFRATLRKIVPNRVNILPGSFST